MEIKKFIPSALVAAGMLLSADTGVVLAQPSPDRADEPFQITTELHCTAPDPSTGRDIDRIMLIVRGWNMSSLYPSEVSEYLSDRTNNTGYQWEGGSIGGGNYAAYFYSNEPDPDSLNSNQPENTGSVLPLKPGHQIGVKVTVGPDKMISPNSDQEIVLRETVINLDCPNVPTQD